MLDIVVTVEARMFLGSCWNMDTRDSGVEPLNIGAEGAEAGAGLLLKLALAGF